MSFASDNWAGASEPVMEALARANAGVSPAYGADDWTARAVALVEDFFEHRASVFFVSTGSAANCLALATYARPAAVAFCHVDAHVARDEAGAFAFYAHGMVLDEIDGAAGRIGADALAARLATYQQSDARQGRPCALTLTNVNELGKVYAIDEIGSLAEIAHARGLGVHVDGARFVNALAATGLPPADLTWRAGVDVVSLGLTKTGALSAEAVVYFNEGLREDAFFRHKQACQQLSKNRFVAAQFVAMLEGGHALSLAASANATAASLAAALSDSPHAQLAFAPDANEVFAFVSPLAEAALERAGAKSYPWTSRSAQLPDAPHAHWTLRRFVTSYRSTPDEVRSVANALAGLDEERPAFHAK